MKKKTTTSIARVSKNELLAYLEEQMAMMRQVNARAAAAKRKSVFDNVEADSLVWEIVPQGDGFKITKREHPLDLFDNGDSISVHRANRTISENLGLDRSIRRGKYNDSMRLIGEDMTGVELGEVQPGSGAGNGFYG